MMIGSGDDWKMMGEVKAALNHMGDEEILCFDLDTVMYQSG